MRQPVPPRAPDDHAFSGAPLREGRLLSVPRRVTTGKGRPRYAACALSLAPERRMTFTLERLAFLSSSALRRS
jgi:hypothetical protein